MNVDDLENIPTGDLTDDEKNKYDGTRTKIANITVKEKDSRFSNGKELPEGQTVKVMVAVVQTESLGLNSLGQPITVKEEFNLKKHPVSGRWGPSLHEKSKSKKLFNKLKVNTFKECIGRDVVVVKKVSETNPNRNWLGISI